MYNHNFCLFSHEFIITFALFLNTNNNFCFQLYQSWAEIREIKLDEQAKRLDRARRIKYMQDQQKDMQAQEQRLWFFENEDKINLEIEEKEKLIDKSTASKKTSKNTDENYIPPEILPKRRQGIIE